MPCLPICSRWLIYHGYMLRRSYGFCIIAYKHKGIEFDKAYVVGNKMSRNEKYIAYTRALSELILVVDDQVADYDDGSSQETMNQTQTPKAQPAAKKKKSKKGVLNYKAGQQKKAATGTTAEDSTGAQTEQTDPEKSPAAAIEEKDAIVADPTAAANEKNTVPTKTEENSPEDTGPAQADKKTQESPENESQESSGIGSVHNSVEVGTPLDEATPRISPALKELPRGYIGITASGAVSGIYYLVPYNGKLRNYTTKKATAMFIPQMRAGKETKVPVSVVEEDRIIFIAKDLYKMYEKGLKKAEELELIL